MKLEPSSKIVLALMRNKTEYILKLFYDILYGRNIK